MSTQEAKIAKNAPPVGDVASRLNTNHVSRSTADIIQRVENSRAVWFAWHCWMDLNNLYGGGGRFNLPYDKLHRMSLIPLPVFQAPNIQPRSVGFTPTQGILGGGEATSDEKGLQSLDVFSGVAPTAKVGGKITQRDLFPSESAKNLLKAYRAIGMTILSSLTAADTAEEDEAFLLYHAIMGTEVEPGVQTGDETLLEEMILNTLTQRSGFLDDIAPVLLEMALRDGVRLPVEVEEGEAPAFQVIKLKTRPGRDFERIGLNLIGELKDGAERATEAAIGESQGVLPMIAGEIASAKMGQAGHVIRAHKGARWLMTQFPSYNMNSDEERAGKLAVDAVRAGSEGNAASEDRFLQLLENQQKTLDLLVKQGAKKGKAEE